MKEEEAPPWQETHWTHLVFTTVEEIALYSQFLRPAMELMHDRKSTVPANTVIRAMIAAAAAVTVSGHRAAGYGAMDADVANDLTSYFFDCLKFASGEQQVSQILPS